MLEAGSRGLNCRILDLLVAPGRKGVSRCSCILDQIWACSHLVRGGSGVAGSRPSEAGLKECKKPVRAV